MTKKNKWWRPTKIQGFLVWMEKALSEGNNAIILTDEELFTLSNDFLEEKDQICYTTFKNYKSSDSEEEKAWYRQFLSLYKKAIISQKKELFEKLQKNWEQWQKYAWIIERKFDDWNLRIKNENRNVDKQWNDILITDMEQGMKNSTK